MKIKLYIDILGADFWCVYECEHCGHEERGKGYADTYFHKKVIPAMACSKCEKDRKGASTND